MSTQRTILLLFACVAVSALVRTGFAATSLPIGVSPTDALLLDLRKKLRTAYGAYFAADTVFSVRWTEYSAGPPLSRPPDRMPGDEPVASEIADPETGQRLFALSLYRGDFLAEDFLRIEQQSATRTLGPADARWVIERMSDKDYWVEAGGLKVKRAHIRPKRSRADGDNLFLGVDIHCPGLVAQIMDRFFDRATSIRCELLDNGREALITAEPHHLRLRLDVETGCIRQVRTSLGTSEYDLCVQYIGELPGSIFPAPQPAYCRSGAVAANDEFPRAPGVPRNNLVVYHDAKQVKDFDRSRFSWKSVATDAFDESTRKVIRADGGTDLRATKMAEIQAKSGPILTQESDVSSGGTTRAVEKQAPWIRWTLALGIAAVVLGLLIKIRRRGFYA
ncbi:MAG: hypothetical protein U0570_04700 [Phycisphaerales bacterium]